MPNPQLGSQALRDRMRSNFVANFPDLVSIWRKDTSTPTTDFGTESTMELSDTAVGNWWSVSGKEALELQVLQVKADAVVSVPVGTDINELDEIIYEVAETSELHHLHVVYVYTGSRRFDKRVAVVEYPFDVIP